MNNTSAAASSSKAALKASIPESVRPGTSSPSAGAWWGDQLGVPISPSPSLEAANTFFVELVGVDLDPEGQFGVVVDGVHRQSRHEVGGSRPRDRAQACPAPAAWGTSSDRRSEPWLLVASPPNLVRIHMDHVCWQSCRVPVLAASSSCSNSWHWPPCRPGRSRVPRAASSAAESPQRFPWALSSPGLVPKPLTADP